jgi:hypothetical protein
MFVPTVSVEKLEDLNKLSNIPINIKIALKIRPYTRYGKTVKENYEKIFNNIEHDIHSIIVDGKFADIPSEVKRQIEDNASIFEYSKNVWFTVRYDSAASKGFEEILEIFPCNFFIVIELTSLPPEKSIIDFNKIDLIKEIVGNRFGLVLPYSWISKFLDLSCDFLIPGLKPFNFIESRQDQAKTGSVKEVVSLLKNSDKTVYIVMGRLAKSKEGVLAYLKEMEVI